MDKKRIQPSALFQLVLFRRVRQFNSAKYNSLINCTDTNGIKGDSCLEKHFAASRAAIGAIINAAAIDQSISHLHFQLLTTVK